MALIPPDAGIRMRMQTEASLAQPVSPVHEISSDLPELHPGQLFAARIQEVLPDNSYKALVAGRQLTLQLPEGAKTGDELELVVLDRSAKVVIARQVAPQPATQETDGPVAYEFATFSPAARMISQLLPDTGKAVSPVPLNRGQPLLAQPPQGQHPAAVLLAPTLARAVAQSGLFYESHQAQWVTGQRPFADLLTEPQGRFSAPGAFSQAIAQANLASVAQSPRQSVPVPAPSTLNPPAEPPGQHALPTALSGAAADIAARLQSHERITATTLLQTLQASPGNVSAGETAATAAATPAATSAAATAPTAAMPEELRPFVQQQLDTLATQRMHWHGEVWPQQTLDWQIQRNLERGADGRLPDDTSWSTTLTLTTPRLGRIDASLQLSAAGVRIVLATPDGASADDLLDEAPKLADALAAASVPLIGLQVRHEETGK